MIKPPTDLRIVPPLQKVTGKTEYTTTLGDTSADICVGDTQATNFLPNIEWSKWNGEVQFKLAFELMNATTEVETFADGTVEIEVGDLTYRAYVYPGSDEVLELEVDIARKQGLDDPYITFALQYTVGAEFHYQHVLTQQEIDDGCYRPPNVEGSYAVYWNKANNEYKTGKICHFYAWEWIDASDNRLHANLEIIPVSPGIALLRVHGDDNWLKFADYPVKVMGKGDTFGYTASGASFAGNVDYDGAVTKTTGADESGTVTSLHVRVRNNSSTTAYNYKHCFFDDNSNCPGTKLDGAKEVSIPANESGDWYQSNYDCSLSASTKYWFGGHVSNNNLQTNYDSVSSTSAYDYSSYALAFGDDKVWDNCSWNERYCMYVTYTVAAAALTVNVSDSFTAAEALD